jgi:hypothetical protein
MSDRLRILIGIALVWVTITKGGGDRVIVPDVDVSGLHVLMLVDQSANNLTPEQGSVLNTTRIPQEVRSQSGEYRRIDSRDDLGPLDEVWRIMAAKMTDPPQMGVLRDRRLSVHRIPNSIDDALKVIGK